MAKAKALAELTDAEVFERLAHNKEELFNLRFQVATGQLDNYARIKMVRRDIARCMTELRDREIAAAEALEVVDNPQAPSPSGALEESVDV